MTSTNPTKTVTVRELARVCEISRMTVSRALRNDPHVRPELREKIHSVAHKLGYRPNPLVSAWMSEIRRSRPRNLTCTIGWICGDVPPTQWLSTPKLSGYYRGAKEAAHSLGYSFDPLYFAEDVRPNRLKQILRARGIKGVVLPPLACPVVDAVPREGLALARIGGMWTGDALHKTMPDYSVTLSTIWHELNHLGWKRFGLCISENHLVESQGNTLAAFLLNQAAIGDERAVPPLVLPDITSDPSAVERWFRASRPEVVITDFDDLPKLLSKFGLCVPSDAGLVHLDLQEGLSGWAGIDHQHELQGATAIGLLARQIERNQTGIPLSQEKVLVQGRWHVGASVQARGTPSKVPDDDFVRPSWYRRWSSATERKIA